MEVDYATAGRLASDIADASAAGADEVVVEFGHVLFCDSSALKVLIGAVKRANALRRRFSVRNPTRGLLRLAEVLGALDFLGLPTAPAPSLSGPRGPSPGVLGPSA